jgi:hypothetical protein
MTDGLLVIPTMVSDRAELMRSLYAMNDATRASALDALSKEAIIALSETALNVVLGQLPASEEQLSALRRHREALLRLTMARTGVEERRRALQRGGLFKSVFAVAAPFVSKARTEKEKRKRRRVDRRRNPTASKRTSHGAFAFRDPLRARRRRDF